ncbi:Apurinic/apyrimidinic (AP) endonuclease [uncultured virus]|nr:Apurinic/apyrimidinic (AP) endonuclease [uncultured virus]
MSDAIDSLNGNPLERLTSEMSPGVQSNCTSRLTLNIVNPSIKISNPAYCLISWNVDRYNEVIHNWLKQLLTTSRPDVVFLSETKIVEDQLRAYFSEFTEYNSIINVHNPTRYHGVAVLIRRDHSYIPFNVNMNIQARQDAKDGNPISGRLIAFQLDDDFIVVGTYVPNSGVGKPDNHVVSKFEYRVRIWDPALQSLLNTFQNMKPTIWLGDINVAPTELDVSNPKTMCKVSGFTPQERHSFSQFITAGNWVDIWRSQHPTAREYTWVSYKPRTNYGMRLDSIIVSSHFWNKDVCRINSTFMMPNCGTATDHVPIGAYIAR